jgi:hypothetical protein
MSYNNAAVVIMFKIIKIEFAFNKIFKNFQELDEFDYLLY